MERKNITLKSMIKKNNWVSIEIKTIPEKTNKPSILKLINETKDWIEGTISISQKEQLIELVSKNINIENLTLDELVIKKEKEDKEIQNIKKIFRINSKYFFYIIIYSIIKSLAGQ
jgi:hypothetical protein